MPYQLMNLETGQFATKRQSGGFHWGGPGTTWSKRHHLMSALTNGSLRKLDTSDVLVIEVEYTPVGDCPLHEFMQGLPPKQTNPRRVKPDVTIPLED